VPSKHDPADCLADILENIERIGAYMASLDRTEFARDGRTRDAVERCLERICEAVYRLGDQRKADARPALGGSPFSGFVLFVVITGFLLNVVATVL
jgi:uncharacterized protein with HEPN domain